MRKLIVVYGPTGSGKTNLAIDIAKKLEVRLFQQTHVKYIESLVSAPN